MSESFSVAPAAVTEPFKETFGVIFKYGDKTATPLTSIIILLATAAIFYTLALINISRKQK